MATALETIVKQLSDSGIVAQGKLENFIPPKAHPKNVEELVSELVKQNHLTKFQAQQVAQGKFKALILGNYTIVDKIGAGGMGQVFKAEHRRMKRIVAIKMLPAAMMKDAAASARFQREVEAAAKLSHPNIVAAYDADEANGAHFLVMEYIEGKDLSALVKKNGPFPVAKAVNYILQAARGLEFAHSEGVIHRDIKPANLLLDKKGVVKILDMGLARIDGGSNAPAQAELTGTGAVMGTVDYMAPEQAMSTRDADARADIYSLGCSLHYLIAGKATYGGESVIEKLLAHREKPIPNLRDVSSDVSEELEAVFRKMVAKNIEDRYQTMTEVVTDLERCSSGQAASMSIQQTGSTDLGSSALSSFPNIQVAPTIQKTKATKHVAAAKSGDVKQPPWKNTKVLIGAGAAGLLFLLLGVWVIVRDKDGNEVAKVKVPDGGSVKVQETKQSPFAKRNDSGKSNSPPKAAVASGAKPVAMHTPAFQQWITETQKLPGQQQIEAVSKKLMELNPGFEGKLTGRGNGTLPKIDNGTVTELTIIPDGITDLSPLRVWMGLKWLELAGNPSKGTLSDLSPLRGMQLTYFTMRYTKVTDLSVLAGMPLTWLNADVKMTDLSLLKGMPLKTLYAGYSSLSDLSPLRGMPLEQLYCWGTQVSDLSPLAECKSLKTLNVNGTKVTAAGVAALQKALPNCKIEWNGSAATTSPPSTPPIAAIGGALAFDGKASYVEIPKLKYNGETPLTLEAWVVLERPETNAEIEVIMGDPERRGICLNFDAGVCQFFGAWNGKFIHAREKAPVPRQRPVHLAGVYDGASELRLYVDGQLQSRTTIPAGQTYAQSPLVPFTLGANPEADKTHTHYFKGQMAGVRISKTARYNQDFQPELRWANDADTTALYLFDEGTGETLNDSSGNSFHGKIVGAKWFVAKAESGKPKGAKLAYADPAFQQWVKATQSLPADKQVEAVSKKLVELNLGFDGKLTGANGQGTPQIENGVVTELGILTENVTDLSPLRALSGLKNLSCSGSSTGKGRLVDLSPLKGLPLLSLTCYTTAVADLSPLAGMQLKSLNCGDTQVSDLSPLKGMPLTSLLCYSTAVSNLSPLAGMPLATLNCGGAPVADLSPLQGMPLAYLVCYSTLVSDLAPLEQCKSLKSLRVKATKVTLAAVAALQRALPNCEIEWDGSTSASPAGEGAKPKTPAASGTK